ncbi:unnamed protein product (macronuclear) [Paramecium tetraurelia]|uniref:MSP domain-containing protein n=1 Tax=Paramecium tetraurelia TaxID=5888 RepID=A0DK12_PARTE|nr:uncharacterized protein GSPATT00017723001 [Paramecium tetraurelia]CAK83379.1 unnamed protein product [Paramecium tetraurelia]|eukprot:XP_001450776.1 hypothetical protein (macronuclear) [Paramecium tetraurelia strain d4-2]
MLFQIDCKNIKQSKQLTLINAAKYPILVRIIEDSSYTVIPSFSLLKFNERKNFQIMPKLTSRQESRLKIEAIEFDETKLETLSVPPFWNERNKGSLQSQSQSLLLSTDAQDSNGFAHYNKSPTMNQIFHDQNQDSSNTNERYVQQIKKKINDHDNQNNSISSITSQQSIQRMGSAKIADDNKFQQSYSQNRKHSLSDFESYGYMSTTQTQQQILKMPNDFNNFLDQIDSSNDPFLIQLPSQHESQTQSQHNFPDNQQQDMSISETTSIQRFHTSKQQFPQLKRSKFNEKSKLRVSYPFVHHPKSPINNQHHLNKNKLIEDQLLKQINELKHNKEVFLQELKKLEFKMLFNCKNANTINQQRFYIWHILITSVLCLLIGSFMKRFIPQF